MNIAALALVAGLLHGATSPSLSTPIKGDYVEARTASVFAGACHYNGEVMITGRDAVMAWNVTSGCFNGIDLTGVRAMAAVSSDANLADESTPARCEIVVDPSATPMQASAMVGALRSRYPQLFAQCMDVRRIPVNFVHHERQYEVEARGFASLDIQGMPNDECCKQPNMVWYSPLVHVDGRSRHPAGEKRGRPL